MGRTHEYTQDSAPSRWDTRASMSYDNRSNEWSVKSWVVRVKDYGEVATPT